MDCKTLTQRFILDNAEQSLHLRAGINVPLIAKDKETIEY